jgi:hypothetical protein
VTVFVPIGKQLMELPMLVVRVPVGSALKVICGMMVAAALTWKEPTRPMRASLVHLAPRLKLGTAVLVLPQRHPFLVAKQAAALHLLSEGRLVLGVGTGWRAAEFALLGADFANRAATTDEAI